MLGSITFLHYLCILLKLVSVDRLNRKVFGDFLQFHVLNEVPGLEQKVLEILIEITVFETYNLIVLLCVCGSEI